MMNHVVLVGRLTERPTMDENKKSIIKLAISRSFKNEEGIYETDIIKIILWKQIAESTCEYCSEGDVIGIKGRINCLQGNQEIVAEKVTFISSRKEN